MHKGSFFYTTLAMTLCASLGLGGMACAATGLQVKTVRSGEVVQVKAQATIQAPLAVVWATLTDYERLPQFVPGIQQSKVLSRKGDVVTVAQTGQARFLFFTVPIDVTVQSTERPPFSIEVYRVSGTLKQLQGRYDMEDVVDKPGWVQLRWKGLIEPEKPLPPLVGEPLMRHLITDQFTGLVREIERRQVSPASGQSAAMPAQAPMAATSQADDAATNPSIPSIEPVKP